MSAPSQYRDDLVRVYAAAAALHDVPVEKMLNAIEAADAFGPLLDPIRYRDGAGAMHQDRDALRAALPLIVLGRALAARAQEARA